MRFAIKISVVIVVAILLISSVYVIFFREDEKKDDENNGGNGAVEDTEAPTIEDITGDTTAEKGESVTIYVIFSDNVGVTEATLYYKTESDEDWSSKSILSGTTDINIPLDSNESWYYYITVDDAAGNGPVGNPSTDGSIYYTITVTEDENGDDEELEHYVFIEEGTGTDCQYCPIISDILYELYNSGDHRFYYMSLVQDKNAKAEQRLLNDYNLWGKPTLFIDGGYKVAVGSGYEKSEIANMITAAESREVPEIQVTVNVEYDNTTENLITEVLVENFENEAYTGTLRVYLTEIISRWNNYDGKPYHFGFLDYILTQGISIGAEGDDSFNETYDASDLDPENLMIIAVVFNSESTQKYSNPDENENPFDAYYADATDATEVVEGGNLPPQVGITNPVQGKIHVFGRPLLKTLFGKTIILGKITITAFAEDDSSIEKVEFYIDDELKYNISEAPYEWSFRRLSLIKQILPPYKHTITVKAYDDAGKTSTASIEVIARI